MKGGARKGAGRPRKDNTRIYVSVALAQLIKDLGCAEVLRMLSKMMEEGK